MNFRLGEFFCGPGGIALAAKQAKVEKNGELFTISHEWANDIDFDTGQTYRRNICPHNPDSVIVKPVEELNIPELSPIDAFAYGFPCNDFSVVGESKGFNGKYGPLYSYGVKVLELFKPLWFFAENVGGLQNANDGAAFQIILRDLSEAGIGYKLTPHLYRFEEYGVPQTRHRIIIIGIRKDLGIEFKVPAPTTPEPEKMITARQAIEIPPIPENAPNNELTQQSPAVIERLKYIPPGKNAWCEEVPEHLRLNVKGARLSQIYRRLDPDKPSYTITGSGGGGTHGYHWNESRALTNRERARIQTFPDDYVFEGKKESVRKQIGMAVPPVGAKIIFEAILKTFAGISYNCVSNSTWEADEIIEPSRQLRFDI